MTAKDDFLAAVNEITEDYKRLEELEYMANLIAELDKEMGYEIYSGNLMSETFVDRLMGVIDLSRRELALRA